ncbi:hypothetical protein PPERSA_01906 [Pseudocohnilembus persalinus]|uniref:USP domain-containing protein n=1 Tax=Pseudocohnilembus persalinus TaxID=266149 RepID=A0A0V0R3E9_PSEPJ|nr:hypothetical protein PPERSA_01906 [Pseudocohnilembus persalinus]|eukprot:KRX09019.1 hypothetical protein PPERSA_01906 [Pseudocohnilembus persalinus]
MEGYLVLDSDFFQNKNLKNTIILGSTALGTGILNYLQLKVLGYLNEQIQFVNIQYKKSSAEVEKLQGDVQKLISDQVYNLRLEKGGDKYVAYIADAFDRVKQRVVRKTQITVYPQILILHIKRLVMNPYGQFQKYALSSIVSHLGNDNFGHYVTFRKSWHQQTLDTKIIGSGNQIYKNAHWFYTSDRDTGFVDKYEIKRANAYILMYSLEDCDDIMEE